MKTIHKLVGSGYILIAILVGCIMYIWHNEWEKLEVLEMGNCKINEFRQETHNTYMQFIEYFLLSETVVEWNDEDLLHYHVQRLKINIT